MAQVDPVTLRLKKNTERNGIPITTYRTQLGNFDMIEVSSELTTGQKMGLTWGDFSNGFPLTIGTDSSLKMNGFMVEVKLYNYALTATEMPGLNTSNKPGVYSNA